MEARHTYTKRVKQECHSDNKAGEADAQLPCANLHEIATKICQQIAK